MLGAEVNLHFIILRIGICNFPNVFMRKKGLHVALHVLVMYVMDVLMQNVKQR
jgi:hypothetical protein